MHNNYTYYSYSNQYLNYSIYFRIKHTYCTHELHHYILGQYIIMLALSIKVNFPKKGNSPDTYST